MSNGYKYDASKGTHFGIAARDLTSDEVEAMGPKEQRTVRLSPAFREFTDDEVKKAEAEAKKAADDAAKAEQAEAKRAEAEAKKAAELEGNS